MTHYRLLCKSFAFCANKFGRVRPPAAEYLQMVPLGRPLPSVKSIDGRRELSSKYDENLFGTVLPTNMAARPLSSWKLSSVATVHWIFDKISTKPENASCNIVSSFDNQSKMSSTSYLDKLKSTQSHTSGCI